MLFDLETDPNEFDDLGADPACEAERQRLMAALARLGPAAVAAHHALRAADHGNARQVAAPGILIGVWDESDVPDELWSKYLGEGQ